MANDTFVCYFARPIDLQSFDLEHTVLMTQARDSLLAAGFVLYEPASAFTTGMALPSPVVQAINREALARCQALVACYPESRSIGVAMEIEQARATGIPTVILTEVGPLSWSVADIPTTPELDQRVATIFMSSIKVVQLDRRNRASSLLVRTDSPDVPLPSRTYAGDAGFDLTVSEDTVIPVGAFRDVPCGISVRLPPGTWGMIQGRSSTLRKHGLLVQPGVIDNGYTGPLFAGVQNMNGSAFLAKAGMRLAQLIPLPLTAAQMDPIGVESLGDSPDGRGANGFGSSGD